MANEFVHGSVGTSLTQAEFEAVGLHVLNSQATGDLIYASSATQLSRIAIGAADTVLTCNGTIPAWSATPILNTAVAKGTWTASGTWTIPAVTLSGALTIGANYIKTTNLGLSQLDANTLMVDDQAGGEKNFRCASMTLVNSTVTFSGNTEIISAGGANGNSILFKARDSDVGSVKIGSLVGAADPYFQIGRDDTGVALNAVTDGLVLQMGGGSGNEAAGHGFGMLWQIGNAASEVEERASIDIVLVTATNGAEDARFDWNLMSGGAMNYAMTLAATGVLSVDLSGTGSAAQVDLFDNYDDAIVLKQGIQQNNRELLADMGILERKNSGSGYMMKLQPMMRLLAGGIYQTRQMLEDKVNELQNRLDLTERKLALLED